MNNKYIINPQVRIGHVHLKVSNLDNSLKFYCDILGFELIQKYGKSAAFISAGGYHHHIGLNTWESLNGKPPEKGTTGLFHLAILYPDRTTLATAYKNLLINNIQIDGASDHGVSEAIYLNDPDHNGLELYYDKAEDLWPKDENGNIQMFTKVLDLDKLIKEIEK